MITYIRDKFKKYFAEFTLFSVEVFILFGIFGGALIAFILIARQVFAGNTRNFDQNAFLFIAGHVSNIHTSIMEFFTFLGTHTFLIPANLLLTAFFLFVKKRRWNSIKIPAVALSSLLLMFVLKLFFQRERPITPLLKAAKGFSFPSGHALMSVTFYGLLIFIALQTVKQLWLKWAITVFGIALIMTIGLSRVYLRVHYASDVLAGFCVGIVWLISSLWLLDKMEKFSNKKIAIKKELQDL
ncbi:MAG: phosphatase PAP2 family protein [Ginsengibacter sp.]